MWAPTAKSNSKTKPAERVASTTLHPPAPTDEAGEAFDAPQCDPEEVARLAYSYWEARGCQGGSPEEDWFRAEQQLRAGK